MRLSVRKQKGQNVVEYLVLVCAAVCIMILALPKDGPLAKAVNGMMAFPVNAIHYKNQEIKLQPK